MDSSQRPIVKVMAPTGTCVRLGGWGATYGRASPPLYAALYPQVQIPVGAFEIPLQRWSDAARQPPAKWPEPGRGTRVPGRPTPLRPKGDPPHLSPTSKPWRPPD